LPASTPLDRQRIADQEQLRELLARPDAGRIVVRLDRIDDPSLARVRSAVAEFVRSVPRHAQLEVPAALALDPAHPGRAVVFAVPLEGDEPQSLLAHLAGRFPGLSLKVQPVPPALLAQLGETVGVAFGEEAPAASPLLATEEHPLHAAKTDPPRVPERIEVLGPPVAPGVPVVVPPDRAEPRPSARVEPEVPAPAVTRREPSAHREPSVYLVWVVEG
jgi:hypothetical protein